MRIGIFGGSFNPPHNMHKNIALNLINSNYVDKIIYIPTGDSYNKKGLINFQNRYNMVNLMIKDYNHLSLSNIGNNENYKYTYQTLDYFKQKYKYSEIYFICGTDNLDDFNNWKEYEYILKNYKLLVIRRNNDNLNEIIKKFENYKESIIITDVKMNNLSSTYIREKIRNEEKVLENLDEKVYSYIKENKLY